MNYFSCILDHASFGTLGQQLFWITKILTFILAFSMWKICQTLMKVWRFQKIKLCFCIHPNKSILLVILQAGQFPQITQMPQYSSKKNIIPPTHDHWAWLLDEKIRVAYFGLLWRPCRLLEFSRLITNWREVIKSLWFLRYASIWHMHEKITLVDFSYRCQQNFLKNYIQKPRSMSSPIITKTNNKMASNLIIKKLNQRQNTFTKKKHFLPACTLNI